MRLSPPPRCVPKSGVGVFSSSATAVAGILYGLPPSHWIHGEARRLLAALAASSVASEGLSMVRP